MQSDDGLQRQYNYPWIIDGLSYIEDKTLSKINRIEGFDVSHFSGDNVTASCVVFDKDGPQKKQYRTFNIKTNKNDDYLAMQEVLSRRFKRLEKDGGNFPDIVVIDGGKGQLSSAKKIIGKFHGCKTKILSLVKGPDRNSKYDDILCFSSGKITRMNLEQEGKRLLQFVRDVELQSKAQPQLCLPDHLPPPIFTVSVHLPAQRPPARRLPAPIRMFSVCLKQSRKLLSHGFTKPYASA